MEEAAEVATAGVAGEAAEGRGEQRPETLVALAELDVQLLPRGG